MTAPMQKGDRYDHPASADEIAALVRRARAEGKLVRVRGAAHSVAEAISPASGRASSESVREVLLDRMSGVRFDDATMRANVDAGCHLGMDPQDPAGVSTYETGLFHQLDVHGWALPDMGGIIHQSIGGFLSTGSSGGSLQHSIYDSIVALRLVDGTGTIREFRRDRDAEFQAAVISMGLCGIVVDVTFQCVPRYHVRGSEVTTKVADSPVDLFGPTALEQYLRGTEHARLLWWPQHGVEKLVVWEARKMKPGDYDGETGPPVAFRPRPYELLDRILGRRDIPQTLANRIFRFFGRLNPPPPANALERLLDNVIAPLYGPTVNAFLRVNDRHPKRFWDVWWRALPMDNDANDDLLPTQFTELWISIEHTEAVMQALQDHYARGGWNATGTYACEIYAAKRSDLWLSPAFQKDVLRIDLFWFAKNVGRPEVHYYPQFWNLLDRFEPRYHWGKHLPRNPDALRRRYPCWNDFMQLRAELDPRDVFLSPYWRAHLGL